MICYIKVVTAVAQKLARKHYSLEHKLLEEDYRIKAKLSPYRLLDSVNNT